MNTIRQLLDQYSVSHKNPVNKIIHWICVPLIMWSLLGVLWLIPIPAGIVMLNGAIIVSIAALIYYLNLSPALAAGMLPVVAVMLIIVQAVDESGARLWVLCGIVFVLAWIGQFIGHAIEGRRPSFLEDVRFLLIGPLWLLAFVYERLGVKIQ